MKPNSIVAFILLGLLLNSCGRPEPELSESEKQTNDSLSKVKQRERADSLRKSGPFVIVPPDSAYTGDYTDKYPNGITKFKGFFRFGQRHGQWLSFFPNGELWSEMHYDKGLRHGPNMVNWETGKLRYSGI